MKFQDTLRKVGAGNIYLGISGLLLVIATTFIAVLFELLSNRNFISLTKNEYIFLTIIANTARACLEIFSVVYVMALVVIYIGSFHSKK